MAAIAKALIHALPYYLGGSMKHGNLATMIFCALLIIAAILGKYLFRI